MSISRFAISAIFFVNGFILASWVARIPAVSQRLELSSAELGIALLGMAVGALLAFPVTGYLIARFSSAQVTTAFGLALGLTLPLLAVASNLPLLFFSLMLFGSSNGGMDVAMNAQGVEVEKTLEKPILNSLHGFFSLGGLVGASLGGGIAALGVGPLTHFLTVTVVALGAIFWLGGRLLPDAPQQTQTAAAPVFALPPRALWGLGVVAFCAASGEGAMADWSALYLHESLGTTTGLAALGYAAFSLTMLIGRFSGDFLVTRFGPAVIVRAGGAVAAIGLAAGLLLGTPVAAIFGFGAVGLGLSVIVPLVFSAAGYHPEIPRGTAVAAVATMGYGGFLVGPPLLGWLAQLSSLRLALFVIVLLGALIVVLAPAARRESLSAKRVNQSTP